MLSRFILILVCLFFATCSAQYCQYGPYNPCVCYGGTVNHAPANYPHVWLNDSLDKLHECTKTRLQEVGHDNMELIRNRQTSVENELRGTMQLVQELTAKVNYLVTKAELQKVVGELNNQDEKSNSNIYKLKSQLDSDREATKSNIKMLQNEFGTLNNKQDNLKKFVRDELRNQDVKSNSNTKELKSQLDSDREATKSKITTLQTEFGTLENKQDELQKVVGELKNQDSDINKLKSRLDSDWEATYSNITALRNEFGTMKNEQDNLKDDLQKFVGDLMNQDSSCRRDIRESENRLEANQNSLTSKIDGTRIAIKTLINDQATLKSEVSDAKQQFRNQLQQLNAKVVELCKQKRWVVSTLANGKTYHFSLQKYTWDMAKTICEEKGMRLASPKTQEEISLLHKKLTELEPDDAFWLSASDAANKGVEYQWLDGEVLNSTLWGKERLPDDDGKGSAFCGYIRKIHEVKLYKDKCTHFAYIICEMQ
ncbi:GRIP and coiled-coil domain-containing protein-like [Cloeon dipterum]|uniref:GRIP and coiled-coil domain-containing protein-like n=1 Tax=Cloeon dipterum TaxID=197152 RepID=UPI00321F8611